VNPLLFRFVAGEEPARQRRQSIRQAAIDTVAGQIEEPELTTGFIELSCEQRPIRGALSGQRQVDHGKR
jgi:hypothetical protein